jgi:uncharacterized membrane protein YoaK (UPF0700 family)
MSVVAYCPPSFHPCISCMVADSDIKKSAAMIEASGFTMGLQNAIVTKLSGAVIRTTHLTGMVTDVGIKLGRMLYALFTGGPLMAHVEVGKLRLLTSLIGLFFTGGLIGALGFKHAGFLFTLPLAAVLLVLAAVPVMDDLRSHQSHA